MYVLKKCLEINVPVNIGGKGVYAAVGGCCHCCFPLGTHRVVWEGEVASPAPSTLDHLTVSLMTWELQPAGVYTHRRCRCR